MAESRIPTRTDGIDNIAAADPNTLQRWILDILEGLVRFDALKIIGDDSDWVVHLPILKAFYDSRGQADGVVVTDSNNLIPTSQIPARAMVDIHVVSSETEQLTLVVQEGDICIRTDEGVSYFALNDANASMSDWQISLTPDGAALSVDGRTGNVILSDLYEPKDPAILTHINDGTKHRLINDSAGAGDTTYLFSADKITQLINNVIAGLAQIVDTPTDGETIKGISSNWAYDHEAAFNAHTHDSRYYTESEIVSLLSGKANTSHTHSYAPLPYTGSTTNNTNFPIGTIVAVDASNDGYSNRNASDTIYLDVDQAYKYQKVPGTSALSGTWRCRGTTTTNYQIFQRVA